MELRRPLTAAAASAVLIALMFVPSASASDDTSGAESRPQNAAAQQVTDGSGLNLAATGSIDTTPYVLAGTAFLGAGTGLVLLARRRGLEQR